MRRFTLLLVLPLALSTAVAEPDPALDEGFLANYQQQYQRVEGLRPDMLVEELRLRIELVASRGSAVGAASNERRVRGFESALLKDLQQALCADGEIPSAAQASPPAPVVESVTSAAVAQRLRTQGADVAEISAITQRLVDSQGDGFCALRSLDDVQ